MQTKMNKSKKADKATTTAIAGVSVPDIQGILDKAEQVGQKQQVTMEQIFCKVATHMLEQGRPAREAGGGGCVYHAADGAMCAVGCLITKENYREELEGHTVDNALVKKAVSRSLGIDGVLPKDILEMLIALQEIHDDHYAPTDWRTSLSGLARQYGFKGLNSCQEAV